MTIDNFVFTKHLDMSEIFQTKSLAGTFDTSVGPFTSQDGKSGQSLIDQTEARYVYDSTNGWVSAAGTLEDLTDTTITTPSVGDAIKYNGSEWVNSSFTSIIEVTVGTAGADYTTIKAAVDAGHHYIRVITDVTESTIITLTTAEEYLIWIDPEVIVTLDTDIYITQGTFPDPGGALYLRGQGTLKTNMQTFNYAYSGADANILDSDGVKFDLSSNTVNGAALTGFSQNIRNFEMSVGPGDQRGFFINTGTNDKVCLIQNGTIIGAVGSSSVIDSSGAGSGDMLVVENVRFTGSYAATDAINMQGPISLNNIFFEADTTMEVTIDGSSRMSNIFNEGTSSVTLILDGSP
jgi:hypothetical protein